MKKNSEITVRGESYELTSPAQMTEMATVLKQHIVKNKLYTPIVGKNYVLVEGWAFAGGMLGLVPIVTKVEDISKGTEIRWRAEVEIVNVKTDKVVGRGFAICSNKENKKRSFDEYAVLSMAQTRAIGKAYRNLIGYVMKMAGYESVPSEEMTVVGSDTLATEKVATKDAPPIENPIDCQGNCGAVISEAEAKYSMRLFGKKLCRPCQAEAKKNNPKK